MEHRCLVFPLALAILMAGAALAAEAADPDQYLNLPYADDPSLQSNLNTLDIYVPQGRQDCPVIVFLHGGTWFQGDKGRLDDKVRAFTDRGYIYVSMNYRLSPDVMHPTHVMDIARGIAWLSSNIPRYGGNPRALVLMGHSAGGHLAALVATDPRYLGVYGLSPANIAAVVGLDSAAYYLPGLFSGEPENGYLFELAFGTDPAFWEEASPLNHVGPGKGIPPFFLVYAGDRSLSHTAALSMAEGLDRAGVTVELWHAQDKDHVSVERDIGKPGDELADRIVGFIESRGLKI